MESHVEYPSLLAIEGYPKLIDESSYYFTVLKINKFFRYIYNILIIIIIIILLIGGAVSRTFGQQSVSQIYLHTDRAAYFPGDTVWFKGYIMRGGKLDSSIRNLYIDWGDQTKNIIQHDVYLAGDGFSVGQFKIPDNYNQEELQLNAISSKMEENRTEGYYKSIGIISPEGRQEVAKSEEDLVETTLPIYSPSTQGGRERNSSMFTIKTVADTTVIQINPVTIKNRSVYLIGIFHHKEVLNREIALRKDNMVKPIEVMTKGWGYGLLKLQIKDHTGSILDFQNIPIGIDNVVKPQLATSGDSLLVKLPDGIFGNISLSVTHKIAPIDSVHHIVADLLLGNNWNAPFPTIDILKASSKSLIGMLQEKSPSYNDYLAFTPDNDKLLYLRGKLLFSNKQLARFQEEYHKLKVKNKNVRGISFGYKESKDIQFRYETLSLDTAFQFEVPQLTFFDSLKVRITQIEPTLRSIPFQVTYTFNPMKLNAQLYTPSWKKWKTEKFFKNEEWVQWYGTYLKNTKEIRLEEVQIKRQIRDQRITKLEKEHAISGIFSGINAMSIAVEDDPRAESEINIFTYLQNQLPSLRINTTDPLRPQVKNNRGGGISFFLNGSPCTNLMDLALIPTSDISYVKYFYPPFVGDPKGGAAIAVYSKKGNPRTRTPDGEISETYVKGYVNPLPFYKNNNLLTPTLLWMPLLFLSAKNDTIRIGLDKLDIQDGWITIQGVTTTGKLIFMQEKLNISNR